MKEKTIVRTSGTGLLVGCILGMAGSVVPSDTFRNIAWAIGSAGIILGATSLVLYNFRKGYDVVAAGFLVLAIGEAVVFASCSTSLAENIPSFAAGSFLWALSFAILSSQKVFPLFVRCTSLVAAILFATTSLLIFTGHPLNPLTKPLPFFAYPFYAASLVGWAWTILRAPSFYGTVKNA